MSWSEWILAAILWCVLGTGFSKCLSRSGDINTTSERFWFALSWPVIAVVTAIGCNWEK